MEKCPRKLTFSTLGSGYPGPSGARRWGGVRGQSGKGTPVDQSEARAGQAFPRELGQDITQRKERLVKQCFPRRWEVETRLGGQGNRGSDATIPQTEGRNAA